MSGGGGVALFNGSDGYKVSENRICGNFSLVYGGGILHYGLSPLGIIQGNEIYFNEAFDEGGGILIGGELVPAKAPPGTLTQGSGSVIVDSNRILGNGSGDDGGGFRCLEANGEDIKNASSPGPKGTKEGFFINPQIS